MEEGPLGCHEVLALVTDYLELALPADRQRRVAGHLEACPECSAWLAQVLATVAALGCLREGIIPPPVLAELRESFGGRAGDEGADRLDGAGREVRRRDLGEAGG
ncbi:zf-HC2 domain-containing protein [Nonomuraea sp. MG754425]|uniref:anti-sigma factor family protein n=1 Tax=Nonomuraea sp. MG754425 TaxID=2570319 RepID=UPI0023511B16|nr:zf-HC2 domain-containing protein [Nonomuraea sp. MG754425]MCF6475530.1 zf-HC2 domain-containing protein [Nonomuraea sp. MG754425]